MSKLICHRIPFRQPKSKPDRFRLPSQHPGPIIHPKPPVPLKCKQCWRPISRDIGCHHCCTLQVYWHRSQRENPTLSREHCILIGAFVSGMEEAFVTEHGRGRQFTKAELEQAVDIAGKFFKNIGYVMKE